MTPEAVRVTMVPTEIPPAPLDRLQRRSLAVGLAALAMCAVGAVTNREQFYRSYLVAYLFWWGIAMGCLGLTMITHLVSSFWGQAARPCFAAGIGTLPLLTVLFLPIAFGLEHIYVWAREDAVRADSLLQKKAIYLNPTFFHCRAAGYFIVWLFFGRRLLRSRAASTAPRHPSTNGLVGLSGIGLVLFTLTTTFAAFDWSMSLEPRWYSTVYGLLIGAGGVLTAMSFVILIIAQLDEDAAAEAISSVEVDDEPRVLPDLATLLLAFLMLWAYLDLSQFLIIWSGNLPTESVWYLRRLQGGWEWAALAVVVLHFAVPFLLLLSRETKCSPQAMTGVALLLLVMHWVELFWNVAPAFRSTGLFVHWLDVVTFAGIGGLWTSLFAWQLRRRLAIHHGRE